jgi:NADPH-dependent curcumin reductase CurA
MISEYEATVAPEGRNLWPLLFNRAIIEGVIISDHLEGRDLGALVVKVADS